MLRLTERLWLSVTPKLFTANGTANGIITVDDTSYFRVKQKVRLKSLTQPLTPDITDETNVLEVKQILSTTQLVVGKKGKITEKANLTAFLMADAATIEAPEQARPSLDPVTFLRSAFEEEGLMAFRTVAVDKYGNRYGEDNPLPVKLSTGSIDIGTVNAELEVQLSHKDNFPDAGDVADSVRIGDGVNEAKVTKAAVGTQTGLNTNNINDLFSKPFNKLTVLTKNDDGDPLTIRSSYQGTPVQLMTIIYDSDGDFQDAEVSDL